MHVVYTCLSVKITLFKNKTHCSVYIIMLTCTHVLSCALYVVIATFFIINHFGVRNAMTKASF